MPGAEHAIQPGGEGTPEIADFAPAELGCSLKTRAGSAKRLIADALDLRYRLPMTWAAARAGQAPVYQARHIATTTRHLTLGQARQVDARIAPTLGSLSWGRLQDVVDGLIYEADPEGADAAAELAARERFVRLGRVTEHGMRLIIAKIAAGDGAWGEAMIARLAEILKRDGDFDGLDIRRSKALGILITQPAEALRLLNSHHNDDEDPAQSPEPDEKLEDRDLFDRCPEPGEETDEAATDEAATDAANADVARRPAQGAGTEVALRQAQGTDAAQGAEAGCRSLRIGPPPFDPAKARPRAIVYVHVSEEALRAGTGVTRIDDMGPVLLTRLRQVLGTRCQIQLKPVINLNDTRRRSTAMRSRRGSPNTCGSANPPTCSPTPPVVAAAPTSTTPPHIFTHNVAARRVRPRSGTSDPWSATTTDSRPTGSGMSDNPNRAPGSGGRLTDASTWSTPAAPTRSANPATPNRSGAPPTHHQRLIRAIRPKEVRSRESCAPILTPTPSSAECALGAAFVRAFI